MGRRERTRRREARRCKGSEGVGRVESGTKIKKLSPVFTRTGANTTSPHPPRLQKQRAKLRRQVCSALHQRQHCRAASPVPTARCRCRPRSPGGPRGHRGAPSAVGEDERRFLERGGANDAAIYVARRAEPLQERQHSGARWWHRHLLPARHLVRPLHWTRTTPPPPAPPSPPPPWGVVN